MNKKIFLIILASFTFFISEAQTYNVSGYIKDAKKQEPIIGAAVFEDNTITNGTPTDTEGYFSLDFKKSNVFIKVGYIGFVDTVLNLYLTKDTTITIFMKSNTEIDSAVIVSDSINWKPVEDKISGDGKNIDAENFNKDTEMKNDNIFVPKVTIVLDDENTDIEELFIQNGQGANQALTFIDGARLYSTKKAFNFIPFIDKNSIKSIDYYYGNFPATYGSYLSPVLDINMKQASNDTYKGSITASLYNAKINAELPVIEDVASLFVAAGVSYFNNPYTNLFRKEISNKLWVKPGAYDIFAKYTHQVSENDKIYTSVYVTADKTQYNYNESILDSIIYSFDNNISEKITNILSSLHWQHVFSPEFVSKVSFAYSRYNLNQIVKGDSLGLTSGIRSLINTYETDVTTGNDDLSFMLNFKYNVIDEHKIEFGGKAINHNFRPSKASKFMISDFQNLPNPAIDTTWNIDAINAQEYIVFAQDKYSFSEELSLQAGLHFSTYVSKDATYFSVEPRIFAKYNLIEDVSVNISYSNHKQYVHSLSNRQVGLTSDVFIGSNKNILPQFTHYASIGAEAKLPFEIDLISNIFYENSKNVIEYKDRFGFYNNNDKFDYAGMNIENRIEQGNENVVGGRIVLKKNFDDFSIKASHYISYSKRIFPTLNFAKNFSYRYNNTHDFSLKLSYKITEELNAGINWMFKTGSYITPTQQSYLGYDFSLGKLTSKQIDKLAYSVDGTAIANTGNVNTYKLPAYHRADLFVNYSVDNHTIGLNIYNVYNRKNADFVDFKRGAFTNATVYQLASYTTLPFFPVLSYTYNFEY